MVKRNFGVKGTAVGAIASRLPVGLGGFAPCNPPAPTLRLIKSVDEATGIVTSEVAVDLSKAMREKYGEGQWSVVFVYSFDKNELNSLNIPYLRNGDYNEYGAIQENLVIVDADFNEGYITLPNEVLTFAVRFDFEPLNQAMIDYANMVSGDGRLHSDWTLNPNGMVDQSGIIYAGRPLVTYDGTGYFAHVVAPVGTVVVDGEDSHKPEVWLPADGKRHEVRTTVGFWGRNIYLTKDNIIRCGRMTFVSDSDTADVDFTTMAGVDLAVAVYAAKQAEQQMAQRIAAAVTAGKAVIDVNPSSTVEQLVDYTDVEFIDPGGLSTVDGGFAYDSSINGGCYRIRMFGKALDEQYITNSIVGLTVGDVGGEFYASSATIESVTLKVTQVVTNGDVTDGRFTAIYVPSALVNDFKTTSIFAADYADIIYPISA